MQSFVPIHARIRLTHRFSAISSCNQPTPPGFLIPFQSTPRRCAGPLLWTATVKRNRCQLSLTMNPCANTFLQHCEVARLSRDAKPRATPFESYLRKRVFTELVQMNARLRVN